MKKNNRVNTTISIIIVILLFVIALVVVIAGYNFIQGFGISDTDMNSTKVLISALKGLSTFLRSIIAG